MKTERSSSMYRSGTMPFSLPKISKLNVKQSRYNDTKNRSSLHLNISKARNSKSFMQQKSPFTARVEEQVLDQNEYPYIQTSNIEKQHGKLKGLLKQFNDETVNILEKYVIDKPVKKEHVKKKPPVQQLYFVRDKQAQNATNLILLLKYEIQKLESRCQNLKYTSKQQFQHKIKQLKEEKHTIIVQNKQISKQITLNGLQMVRQQESLVKDLEYEQFLIDSKRDRLKKQSDSVNSQIISLESKIKEAKHQEERYQQEQSYSLRQYEQVERGKSQQLLYEQMMRKKKVLEHNKVMTQSMNYQLKHRYFQKLKELDDFSNREEQFSKKMNDFEEMIEAAKFAIKDLQKKQSEVKQKYKGSNSKQPQIMKARINYSLTTSTKINVELQ